MKKICFFCDKWQKTKLHLCLQLEIWWRNLMIRIATLDDETQWLTTERIITEQCFESGDIVFSAYNDVDKIFIRIEI